MLQQTYHKKFGTATVAMWNKNFFRENMRLMQRKSSFITAEVGDMLICASIGVAHTVDA
jgi:hypothetical protein